MPLAVCATPIGNLEDVTLRVLAELREADVVLCEDTRHTARLLDRHGIARRREAAELSRAQRGRAHGASCCRGSPRGSVSRSSPTPGSPVSTTPVAGSSRQRSIAACPVTVLPGPSAVETALVASGLAGDQYRFLGYLPRREAEREALWVELRSWPHPSVGFESPSGCRRPCAASPRRSPIAASPCAASSRSGSRRSSAGRQPPLPRALPSRPRARSRSSSTGPLPDAARTASLDAAVAAVARARRRRAPAAGRGRARRLSHRAARGTRSTAPRCSRD